MKTTLNPFSTEGELTLQQKCTDTGKRPAGRPHLLSSDPCKHTLRVLGTDINTGTAEMLGSTDSETNCVSDSHPATHQTVQQQGRTGEDGSLSLESELVGTLSRVNTKD